MDLTPPIPGNSPLQTPLTPVFGDNVQALLNAGSLSVKPTAIIVVNSINDVANSSPGITTLRDAVNKANADAGEDLIVFDRSVFSNPQTINLTLGVLDITKNLDIIAPRDSLTGGDLVTANENEGRVKTESEFKIEAKTKVSIDGLIFSVTNGFSPLVTNSGTLNISNSIITRSIFSGIVNTGSLTLHNSTLTGNGAGIQGSRGGGIQNSGTLNISNSIITGSQAQDGGGIYTSSGTVKINNSTISNNSVIAFGGFGGGGIFVENGSTVEINKSTINGNSSTRNAGGIANFGTLKISNSTVNGNTSNGNFSGGGIYNNATLTISNSTISNNLAPLSLGTGGGGIFNNNSGTLMVVNSTISGNEGSNGGGISNTGVLTLVFSTITGNKTYFKGKGGGVFSGSIFGSFSGSTTVRNTIIARNFLISSDNGSVISPDDLSGNFTSNGYNLIGDGTGSTGFGVQGDIVGTSNSLIDPLLGPLASNGGPTQTIALLPGSPAINAGDPTVLPTDPKTDQRGKPRVRSGRADIGAFESSLRM